MEKECSSHDPVCTPFRIDYHDKQIARKLSEYLLQMLPHEENRPIVFVCIGTDRSTGDALGPLVGMMLEEKKICSFHIYGTLEEPVHAVNLKDKLALIEKEHENPFIIAIDACLGRLKNVGIIQIGEGPVKPGAGVKKELPFVGDMHITGIVNMSGFMEFLVLQNTRLNIVMKMAKRIADGIHAASIDYRRKYSVLPMLKNQKEHLS
ncbi:spore protease YyaC [Bacillus chungangensis]|uniref:Sporulation protein YyaC n=1 Tax=Bacillus chungangensis TaxID=587633 RepID=A0ABT9WSM5_9BACI|nr:spore protease YyaC [Bacillus chungangensis]MDQ0176304.1 putative sporulation protein YyaC [Bacillus chungangensis]